MKTIAERLAALEAQVNPKRLRMKAIIDAAYDDGERDLDESEAAEFDELKDEVKELDVQIDRLKSLESSLSTARPVNGNSPDEASRSRGREPLPAQAKAHEEKGVGFARAVMLYTHSRLKGLNPMELAKTRYPNLDRQRMNHLQDFLKATVAGGTTVDPTWAAPLVQPTDLVTEFVEFLRPMTIIGRFGTNGIPSLRSIPFNVQFPAQTSGGDGYWVGEGKAKPLTKFDFDSIILRWTKVANIAVVSEDLLRFSTPSAEIVVRNALAEALQARLDVDFVDPSVTLIADTRPASITNGAANTASSGTDADAVRADIATLLAAFVTANIGTGGLVFIMRQAQALKLMLMRNALGQREFPDITLNGGMLEGIPVITSQHVATGIVAAVAAPEIYLADDGGVSVDLSREASLEMQDQDTITSETNDGSPPAPTAASLVSMFQTNSVAIRAERLINWRRRRTAAVAYLTGVGWGNPATETSPPTWTPV